MALTEFLFKHDRAYFSFAFVYTHYFFEKWFQQYIIVWKYAVHVYKKSGIFIQNTEIKYKK